LRILGYKTEHESAGHRLKSGWRQEIPPDTLVFNDLTAIVEWQHWWRVAKAYPDASLILSYRDPEAWYRSISSHIAAIHERAKPSELQASGLIHTFAFGSLRPHKVLYLDRYHTHRMAVQGFAYTHGRRLLIVDPTREGWDKLCRFLQKPIPQAPWPWKNRLATPSR
jgi:hypothetical protein